MSRRATRRSCVSWVTCPTRTCADLYRLADLFVMPSSEEGFGIVYLEAAACGLRVIGGAGGGSGDAIPVGVGTIVDPADQAGLIETVTRLLGQGRVDPVAIEPYRRPHFAATAGVTPRSPSGPAASYEGQGMTTLRRHLHRESGQPRVQSTRAEGSRRPA